MKQRMVTWVVKSWKDAEHKELHAIIKVRAKSRDQARKFVAGLSPETCIKHNWSVYDPRWITVGRPNDGERNQ